MQGIFLKYVFGEKGIFLKYVFGEKGIFLKYQTSKLAQSNGF